jgi:predicted  nucleic acid-binding Zn-ribbon protein
MKLFQWIALLACLTWATPAQVHSAASPQDDYLQIYVMIQEGDKLAAGGQNSQGREKYETAVQRLEKLKNENPEWEPTIVKYRIKYLNEKLDALKSAKDPAPTAKPAPTPSPTTAAEKPTPSEPKSEIPPAPTSASTSSPAVVVSDDPSALRQKIISLSGDLESARTELRQAKSELDTAVADKKRLQEKLSASPSPDANLAKLQDENTSLRGKLTAAEESLKKAAGGEIAGEMTSLRGQVDQLEKKLAEANNKSAELARANEEYKTKIASLTAQLQQAGPSGKSDTALAKENVMLRSILDRQLKEQARREAARRLVLDEFKNLAVSTDALKTQMDVLSSPLVALTEEEQGMLINLNQGRV